MKTMPTWLTRTATTSAEFAERVEEARRDIKTLTAEKQTAQSAYDAAPSAKAEDLVLAADEALRRGQLRLESAERALNAAKAAEREKGRAALQTRRDALEADLSRPALTETRAPGVKAEVKAVLALVDVQVRRTALELTLLQKQNELNQVLSELGEPLCSNVQGIAPDRAAVAMALADHLHTLPSHEEDYARRWLQQFLLETFGGIPTTWTPPSHANRQAAE